MAYPRLKAEHTEQAWERRLLRARLSYQRRAADPERRARMNAHSRKDVAKKRAVLKTFKEAVGCLDCGTREGRLDFDHRPGTVKEFNLAHPRCSWERLWAEVAKCDVRCAACHTKRHMHAMTHCRRGHRFDEANTYHPPSNPQRRMCRACSRERDRKRQRRRTTA